MSKPVVKLTNKDLRALNAGHILKDTVGSGLCLKDGKLMYVACVGKSSQLISHILSYPSLDDMTFTIFEPDKTITVKQSELDELKKKIAELESRGK